MPAARPSLTFRDVRSRAATKDALGSTLTIDERMAIAIISDWQPELALCVQGRQ
jgi:hypothetical protein